MAEVLQNLLKKTVLGALKELKTYFYFLFFFSKTISFIAALSFNLERVLRVGEQHLGLTQIWSSALPS